MPANEKVAVVLSGGGARGAYEIGVLSALLPALDARRERPQLAVGTSIGALNAAYLAATACEPVDELIARAKEKWLEISPRKIWRRSLAPHVATQLAAYGAHLWGLGPGARGFLDPEPVAKAIADIVPFEQLHENVANGHARVAVAATSAFTSETVVFHAGDQSPPPDTRRGITYRLTPKLGPEHVQASAAIPGAFPAVRIESPDEARGWYFDGGARLNAPIKPAIELGADRILVIGLNSIAMGQPPPGDRRPDIFDGVSQVAQAMFADALAGDMYTLARDNRIIAEARAGGVQLRSRCLIRYAFVTPQEPDAIGRIAQEVFKDHFPLRRGFLRGDELAVLGRMLGAAEDPLHGELFSYLFFAGEFTKRLLELGKADGDRWLALAHDDDLWRIGSDPP